MVQEISRSNRQKGLGESLGSGVITGLRHLLDTKVDAVSRKPVVNSLIGAGIDPQSADYISRQPSEIQQKLLQNYSAPQQQQQQGGYQPEQPSQQPYQMGQQFGQQQRQQQAAPVNQFGGNNEKQLLARQKAINTMNAPYVKNLSKGIDNAESALDALQNMKQLLQSGKVATGLKGKLTPGFFLNTESQLFDKYSNQLAQQLSGQTGVPTGFKIKFALTQKPNLEQNFKTQETLTNKLIEDAEKILLKGQIRDMIIEENGMEQPANLETLVNKRFKAYQNNPYRFMAEMQQDQELGGEQGFNPQQEQQMAEQQANAPAEGYDTSNESLIGTVARRGLSGLARAGEAIVGAPGDISDLALAGGNYLTGGALPEKSGLPTSQSLQEATGKLTKGYTNPTSETEKSIDNIVSIAASLFLPSKIKAPFINNLTKIINPKAAKIAGNVIMPFSGTTWQKSLKMGAAGEFGSRTAEAVGGGPLAQAASKVAFMTLAGTKGTRASLENAKEEAYATRDSFIKGGVNEGNVVPVTKLTRDVKEFSNRIRRSAHPDAELVGKIADEVENGLKAANKKAQSAGFKNGADIKDVLRLDQNMNRWHEKASTPFVSGQQHLPETARPLIDELGRILDKPINSYGLKNPEFGFNHALGKELHAGLNAAKDVSKMLSGTTFSSNPVSYVLKNIGKGTLIAGGQKVADFYALLKESPRARQAYFEAILGATNGDQARSEKAAQLLDSIAVKLGYK